MPICILCLVFSPNKTIYFAAVFVPCSIQKYIFFISLTSSSSHQCAGCLQHHKLVDNLGLVVEYDLRETNVNSSTDQV